MGSFLSCAVLGGIISTSDTQVATCITTSDTIYITNVAGFQMDPSLPALSNYRLKIRFRSDGVTDTNDNTFYHYLKLYANIDAYNSDNHGIFNERMATSVTTTSCSYYSPTDCRIGYTSGSAIGVFQVQ